MPFRGETVEIVENVLSRKSTNAHRKLGARVHWLTVRLALSTGREKRLGLGQREMTTTFSLAARLERLQRTCNNPRTAFDRDSPLLTFVSVW